MTSANKATDDGAYFTRRALFAVLMGTALLPVESQARGGCGSRGGPGYRKANGKCAGWNDYQDGHTAPAAHSSPAPVRQPQKITSNPPKTANSSAKPGKTAAPARETVKPSQAPRAAADRQHDDEDDYNPQADLTDLL